MPASSLEQGKILTGKVGYERRFALSDDGLKVSTTLRPDGTDKFREVYEVLPVFLQESRTTPKAVPVRILYRDGEPIAVRLAWWKDDPHPATQAVLELLTALYREA